MKPLLPAADAPLEQWIDWLSRTRTQQPSVELKSLLSGIDLSHERLLDLACMDLIAQRRSGVEVTTETYLQQFSQLRDSSSRLDLIDAELCVLRELRQTIHLDPFVKRFPDLADEIQQLFGLEVGEEARHPIDFSMLREKKDQPQQSGRSVSEVDFSFDERSVVEDQDVGSGHERRLATVQSPVAPPPWIRAIHCVASGPDHWLMRGRDSKSGENLAMKVVRLPGVLSPDDRKRILDVCEQSSQVTHPGWVTPRVAAIEKNHLAVIRPWVFGLPLDHAISQETNPAQVVQQLRRLAIVAFALNAGHLGGASHGAVHTKNLIIDHEGAPKVLDAASSLGGWTKWLANWDSDASDFQSFRIQNDVRDLARLISADAILLTGLSDSWTQSVAKWSVGDAGDIGDALLRKATEIENDPGCVRETGNRNPSPWVAGRKRLARFFQNRSAND